MRNERIHVFKERERELVRLKKKKYEFEHKLVSFLSTERERGRIHIFKR